MQKSIISTRAKLFGLANNLVLATALTATLATTSHAAPSLKQQWQTTAEFKAPESVVYHAHSQQLFVSNVNGTPNEKDGNGYISTVSSTGETIQAQWLTGLNAPKGMAIMGNKLYVSDIDQLVEIDIKQGEIVNRYNGEEAVFLNDIAIDKTGNVYVSDMVTNRIYRLKEGDFSVWLSGEQLENPNGLLIKGDTMIVASWGKMTDGFSTAVPGHLKQVSLTDKSVISLGEAVPVGNLDGITQDKAQGYFVTDWMQGGLFHFDAAGKATAVLDLNQGSADHTYIAEQNLLIIPMMTDGTLAAYSVE